MKGGVYMCEQKKRLLSNIYFLEDKMLRSKNIYEIESLRSDLMRLRTKLQKLEYKERH